ncbi:MAG: hypothetical protein SPJ27_07555 [Candidatus Onthovivens sp.]|nr:hypothetical protein [Candidatus Onthovivens sp.]
MIEKKQHNIKVNLSDKDYNILKEYAKKYNISLSQLIEAFIKDLVFSDESNGSDERRIANEWYDRNYCNYKD